MDGPTHEGRDAPTLETERLLLRVPGDDDLPALVRVFGDPEVMRYVADGMPRDLKALEESQCRIEEHWRAYGFGPLVALERAGGRLVGEAGLQVLEGGPDVELTYSFARAVWGQGYGVEAGAAVLRWAFGPLELPRVVAVVYPANVASRRVLERLGFAATGRGRHYGADLLEFELSRQSFAG